jgi:hypothetical protein
MTVMVNGVLGDGAVGVFDPPPPQADTAIAIGMSRVAAAR